MGASLTFFYFHSKAYAVADEVMSMIRENESEHGSGAYSGDIGQKQGVKVLPKVFSSMDEMESYCEKQGYNGKWDDDVYVAEIRKDDNSTITKTKTLIGLEESHKEVKDRLDRFESDILENVKLQTSKTKSCKSCGHRHDIANMTSLRCSKCRSIMLTTTQKGEKSRLQEKARGLKSKIDKAYLIPEKKIKQSMLLEAELKKRYKDAKAELDAFEGKVLMQVKRAKSKTKSCKGCGTRYQTSNLSLHIPYAGWGGQFNALDATRFICPNCKESMLSTTQKKQRYALENKVCDAKYKLDAHAKERTYALYSWCSI